LSAWIGDDVLGLDPMSSWRVACDVCSRWIWAGQHHQLYFHSMGNWLKGERASIVLVPSSFASRINGYIQQGNNGSENGIRANVAAGSIS
jgi:cbb3-type cytochrome oxidase subunit 1